MIDYQYHRLQYLPDIKDRLCNTRSGNCSTCHTSQLKHITASSIEQTNPSISEQSGTVSRKPHNSYLDTSPPLLANALQPNTTMFRSCRECTIKEVIHNDGWDCHGCIGYERTRCAEGRCHPITLPPGKSRATCDDHIRYSPGWIAQESKELEAKVKEELAEKWAAERERMAAEQQMKIDEKKARHHRSWRRV
jgi:hypothetical protein